MIQKPYVIVFLLGLWMMNVSCQSSSNTTSKNTLPTHYRMVKPSRDGTGKVYMGREIAQVMGHFGASWLERVNRNQEENTDLAIEQMNIQPDMVVADIGAGTGYYAFKIATQNPQGKVYAVDIQPEMLTIMQTKIEKNRVANVSLVLGDPQDPHLPDDSIDLAIMVDVYHELAYPREMMLAITKSLKKGGRFVLLEYRMEDPKVPIKKLHKMSLTQSIKEIEAIGLTFKQNIDHLPWQHFMIFEKQ